MGLAKSSTTRPTIMYALAVSFLVLAIMCSTLPSCHPRNEVKCKPLDPCDDAGCKTICAGTGLPFASPFCKETHPPLCCCIG
ncbi:hypothetical protein ZWY2020_019590 [Hordeum vulgare]|nr:hypothetical protein ZWY2020_019590 [Hordeum vulgare]